ncbi:MAG: hypothetical protein GY842_20595 [bacterium]|nr:hypothetical protein [bacterium]
MIARYSGATLGLLAFSIAVLGGLWTGNSVTETLTRAIWSLVIFCALGLAVGTAAQAVVAEFARRRFDAVRAEAEAEAEAAATVESEAEQDPEQVGAPETG